MRCGWESIALEVVNDVLDLSRLDAGAMALEQTGVDGIALCAASRGRSGETGRQPASGPRVDTDDVTHGPDW